MSNREFRREQMQTRPAQDLAVQLPQVVETREQKREVGKHRECPLCYGGLGGIGQSNGTYEKASTLHQRFYKCDRCGHTWSIYLKPEEVVGVNANMP